MPTVAEGLAEAVATYVEMTRRPCWDCGGSGWKSRPDPLAPLVCGECGGAGDVTAAPLSVPVAAGILQDVVIGAHAALNAGDFDALNALLDWAREYALSLAATSVAEIQGDPELLATFQEDCRRATGTASEPAPTGQLSSDELNRLLHDDDQGGAEPPR